jgi:hypothetical protein
MIQSALIAQRPGADPLDTRAPRWRDPIVFAPVCLDAEDAAPTMPSSSGAPGGPPAPDHSDYAYCVDLADVIGDLLALPVRVDVLEVGTEVLLAWDANRTGCQLDSEQAGEWRERLGLDLTEMLQAMDDDPHLATLEASVEWAHALGINNRELHWRLERAGQQRLPL